MLLVIAAVLFLFAYSGSFSNPLVLDDLSFIRDKKQISSSEWFVGSLTKAWGPYLRPLQSASYACDRMLWGEHVEGYRLSGLFWFAAAAAALYFFLCSFGISPTYAWFGALLWSVHPANSSLVYYLSNRADVFAVIGMMLSLAGYLRWEKSKRTRWFALAIVSALFSYASKENAYILPALVLLFAWRSGRKSFWHESSWFFVLGAYLLFRSSVVIVTNIETTYMVDRIPSFFAAVATYARLLVFPADLHFDYGPGVSGWGDARVWVGVAIALLWVTLIWQAFLRRNRDVLLWSLFVVVAFVPISGICAVIYSFVGEHMLAFPSIALVAWGMTYAQRVGAFSSFRGRAFGAIFVIACVFGTRMQNSYWSSEEGFYTKTIAHKEVGHCTFFHLSALYDKRGEKEKAEKVLYDAIDRFPYSGALHLRKASFHLNHGELDDALKYAQNAVLLGVDDGNNFLGIVYANKKMYVQAYAAFAKALTVKSDMDSVMENIQKLTREVKKNAGKSVPSPIGHE